MSRAASPLKDRMIFNVGARRSGTLWLQRIVTAHPEVAAVGSETHLFTHGIAPLFERFSHGVKASPQVGKIWIEREDLLDAARDFCDRVFAAQLEPGVPYLAERTPVHVFELDLIAAIYPDARVVHIIRDGRDVARSLVAKQWGPGSVEEAAAEWRDSVLAAREASVPRYTEVFYERLLADPEGQIRDLFEKLDVPLTEEALAAAGAEARETVNVDGTRPTVEAAKWRTAFGAEELEAFDRVAGDLLGELGYERSTSPTRRLGAGRLARLRRGRRSVPEGRPVTDAKAARMAIDLLDELLVALKRGEPERGAGLLAPNATFELISGEQRSEATGEAAREAIAAMLREDPSAGARQRSAEVFVKPSSLAAVVRFGLDDGREAERVYVLSSLGDRIGGLTVFQLPVRKAATVSR